MQVAVLGCGPDLVEALSLGAGDVQNWVLQHSKSATGLWDAPRSRGSLGCAELGGFASEKPNVVVVVVVVSLLAVELAEGKVVVVSLLLCEGAVAVAAPCHGSPVW
jgi:hypothetical protein